MKFNLLVSTSQINSKKGKLLGTGSVEGLRCLAEIMVECRLQGDIYDLPNGSRDPTIASPFSLTNGFALTTDELNLFAIQELESDPDFTAHLRRLHQTDRQLYLATRTVSYTLKRTLLPWVLEHCFARFKQHSSQQRQAEFERFCQLAAYWLDDYALYEVYKEQAADLRISDYRDPSSTRTRAFKEQFHDRIAYYQYTQFLCYEQRTAVHNDLKKLGIGLIVNLPFGVELNSADVFFHPEVFESDVQVGCSPEPEHGYPEQAWGVAVYKERTAGLQQYLTAKMNWISLLGDGVFLDHLVGWCGQYVVPLTIPEGSTYPHGRFLTEDQRERTKNLVWFLEIIDQSGLQIRGEVAGDGARVKATREVIDALREKGKNISAMAIPRWEAKANKLVPLSHYQSTTLMMVETHDTSTQLQYLLNKKGYFDDFETPQRIREYCNRVLGLPFLLKDVPLMIKDCTEDFWLEICSRLCRGTSSEDVVFTLPGLISLLSSRYRSPTIENNINVKPGTPGTVGNGWRNWSYFSPPIEILADDPALKSTLRTLGQRAYVPFDYFHVLETDSPQEVGLCAIYSYPSGRRIIYRDSNRCWRLLPMPPEDLALLRAELVIGNTGEKELWQRIDLSQVIDLNHGACYSFQDLNGKRERFDYASDHLRAEFFFVKLQPGQIHHFLVCKKGAVPSFDFPD